MSFQRQDEAWRLGIAVCPLVEIDFVDEVIFQHFGDEQQAFHVDVLAVEDVVEGGPGTVDLAGEFGITDAAFVHFLLDNLADVDVLEL